MKIFKNKVAVITGAASGIGRAIADHCAQKGMKVVLAGINESNLALAESELKNKGANVLSVRTDVSKVDDVEMLAKKTLDTFGGVHLLFNNAGVGAGSSVWGSSVDDWKWVIDVNLWGVIHGVRVFVPLMLAQNTPCHIVNVSSVAGLVTFHPSSPYHVTKHAVVALSENLYHSLTQRNAKVKVSVLCPGWVKTRILESGRNRPAEYMNSPDQQTADPETLSIRAEMREALEAGMDPDQLAEIAFNGIRKEEFYILSHPEYNPAVQQRMEDILAGRNPS